MPTGDAPASPELAARRREILTRIARCLRSGQDPAACLLAVSKTRTADEVRALAAAGQVAFGENYVQEGVAKRAALADLELEWHLIGPLQSNKCRIAAQTFDWIHGIDRIKLLPLLARERDPALPPLNVLLQVNIDDEASKSGCAPADLPALAAATTGLATLRLRGLMAIPSPDPDFGRRRDAFARMRALFDGLRNGHPHVDTLSMGMSEDFELALQQGATLVRVGTALFGPRAASPSTVDAA